MKRLLTIFLSLCCLSAIAQTEVKKVAILETVDKMGNVPYGVLLQVRSSLTYAISSNAGYEGYDRVDMAAITGEQNFQRMVRCVRPNKCLFLCGRWDRPDGPE